MLLAGSASAQQVPQYSQYLRNQYMVNPGAAGVYDFFDVTVGGRMQWLGFEDAPKTTYLYASAPLSKQIKTRYNPALRVSRGPIRNPTVKTGKLKHALGGQVVADQYGAFRHLKFAGTYALHIPVAKNYNLSLGTSIGISNRSFLSDKANVLSNIMGSGTDQTYEGYTENSGGQNTLDIDLGLYFYSNNLFIGVAASQLTRDLVRFGNKLTNFDPGLHLQITAGYKFPISENMTLMPAILVKQITPAPLSIDGSIQVEYKEWLWAGVSYRNQDAVVAMAGLNISRKFKFGYSYDFNISRLNNYSSGGHEIVLGLMLGR
jgi:type IX secretion system PorP/SprF family membrane protein